MGPRAGLDRCGKSRHHRDSIPGPSPGSSRYTDYTTRSIYIYIYIYIYMCVCVCVCVCKQVSRINFKTTVNLNAGFIFI